MQQSNLKKEDNNLAIAHNSFNSCRNLKEIRSFSLNFKVGSVLTMVKVVKVPNQHLPRVRNGRVVRPAPAAVPGPSPSSRRKSTRNVAQQKEKRSSFFVPHLDQEYKQKVNQIARTYNIYVGIAKNKQNLMAKLTLFSGFRNWSLLIARRKCLCWIWTVLWSTSSATKTLKSVSLCGRTCTTSWAEPTKSTTWCSGRLPTWLASRKSWKGSTWTSTSTTGWLYRHCVNCR